jgi:hypothetical protein
LLLREDPPLPELLLPLLFEPERLEEFIISLPEVFEEELRPFEVDLAMRIKIYSLWK